MRIAQLASLLAFSLVIRPLSLIWPKDRSLVAFIPRDGKSYVDNVCHFFEVLRIEKCLPKRAYLLVTSTGDTADKWNRLGRATTTYNPFNWRELRRYLATSVVISDSWHWSTENRISCFAGAKKVQIWHGIPLKKIELANLEGSRKLQGVRGLLERALFWLKGRYPRYDLLVSTSPFFERETFRTAFRAKKWINCGYPRNDFLFADAEHEAIVDTDEVAMKRINQGVQRGRRIVTYTPTFRDSGGDPFSDRILRISHLQQFSVENNIIFVFKLHPFVPSPCLPPDAEHLVVYDSEKDAAPLLKATDLLVTDYSSIFFDFLLLSRPVVFFPYDLEKYFQKDRGLFFDYFEFTPGAIAKNLDALLQTILNELHAPDPKYKDSRSELRARAFVHHDGNASRRLWDEIAKFS